MINKKTHENIKCSKCGQFPIEGIRYYCLTCMSYELCSSCEKIYGEMHGHALLKIRNPADFDEFKSCILKQKKSQNLQNVHKKYIKLFEKHL